MEQGKISPRISEDLQAFKLDRQAKHLSPCTVDFYMEKLKKMCTWMEANDVHCVEDITAKKLREYLIYLENTHNPGGVHAFWRSIRAFLKWYDREYDADWDNPLKRVDAPKCRYEPIVGVQMTDVFRMIDACDQTFTGVRDVAIMRTLIDTGLRRTEFCDLRIQDLNMENGEIKIYNGKGAKRRTVVVGPTARRDIMRYLRRRKSRDPRDFLWVTVHGEGIRPDGLRHILRHRAEQAQVPVPSPHDFRRTFALECLRNGMDLVQLRRLMGHTTTLVLERYLALQTEDLVNAHAHFGPIDHIRRR